MKTKTTLLIALAAVATSAQAVTSFTGLGDLSGGTFESKAFGISADGNWIVGQGRNASGVNAVRWNSALSIFNLGDLPGGNVHTVGYSISADGSTVVGAGITGPNGAQSAYKWRLDTGFVLLDHYLNGVELGVATDISDDGLRVSGTASYNASYQLMTLWTTQTPITLGDLPGGVADSDGRAISADGSTIVGSGQDASGDCAAYWTQSTGLVALPKLLAGFPSTATDTSSDGRWIVGQSSTGGSNHAVLWDRDYGTVQSLGFTTGSPHMSAACGAISRDGRYIVGYDIVQAPNVQEATLWDRVNGMRTLKSVLAENGINIGSWQMTYANDIAVIGNELRIVGYGINTSGDTEGYLVKVPRPRQILSGQVDLEDFTADMAGQQIDIQVKAGEFFVDIANATLDSAGRFTAETECPIGTYDVLIKGSHWLRKRVGGVDFHSTTANVTMSLINGDVDGNNEVSIGDYSGLSFAYNSFPGDWNWDINADLNGDEGVDVGDYAILSANYGLFGDE